MNAAETEREAKQLLAELAKRIEGLQADLATARVQNASQALQLREAENQLAEKTATITRLQTERARVWNSILEQDADGHRRDL